MTELSQAYTKLLLKRDNLVRAILTHGTKIKSGATAVGASTRFLQLEGSYEKYKELWEKLEEEDEFDLSHFEIDNESVTEAYINTVTMIKSITKDHGPNEMLSLNSTMANRCNNGAPEIKLPTISIPKFDGKELEWTTFYDTFSSLVDQNPNIPKISKIHYLRDSLKGEAFQSICKLPASEANYDIAWKVLLEQYHNTRAIVNDCLNSFIFQE
ncbi:uncharacterized protein LOC129572261 [Sitodiplosis mosellana]|uniref:uncharacterized protein LOC129572261 n=1 Tax=Sitodiplosis mosellana TaxID=263140 RepID=UPI00244537C9|nr:uncharacterized protein LOC129572261 [Sitodiplosis mosellana]